jgi:hypothetical protein
MRVDVTTVRRDVDARTAKGARTPTLVAKTEAIDGSVSRSRKWNVAEIERIDFRRRPFLV